MKVKSLLLVIAITLTCTPIYAGDVYDKMAKKICKCLKKDKVQTIDEAMPCMQLSMIENLQGILDYHGAATMNEIDGDMVGNIIGGNLAASCPYMIKLIPDSVGKQEVLAPDSTLNCQGLQTGEYYYIKPGGTNPAMDTVYVTFTKTEYVERANRGKKFERSKLVWKDDCNFSLILIETNDDFVKSMRKPGDKQDYTIIKNTENLIVLDIEFQKRNFQFEFFKVDPKGKK